MKPHQFFYLPTNFLERESAGEFECNPVEADCPMIGLDNQRGAESILHVYSPLVWVERSRPHSCEHWPVCGWDEKPLVTSLANGRFPISIHRFDEVALDGLDVAVQ